MVGLIFLFLNLVSSLFKSKSERHRAGPGEIYAPPGPEFHIVEALNAWK